MGDLVRLCTALGADAALVEFVRFGRIRFEARLNQLVAAERIPFEVHTDGRRIYRRGQLLILANARDARWHDRPRPVGDR